MKNYKAMKLSGFLAAMSLTVTGVASAENQLPDPDGKPADMTKPVQVYILMGQSNMLGFGKIGDDPGGILQKAHAGFGQPDGTGRAYKQGG